MKRLILITWLLICLLPLTVKAEEPVKTPAGEGAILALSPHRPWIKFEPSLQEWEKEGIRSISADEMADIRGRSLKPASPPASSDVQPSSRVSAIILWDEARTNTNMSMSMGHNNRMVNSLTVTDR
jgi:hypothetical protein